MLVERVNRATRVLSSADRNEMGIAVAGTIRSIGLVTAGAFRWCELVHYARPPRYFSGCSRGRIDDVAAVAPMWRPKQTSR